MPRTLNMKPVRPDPALAAIVGPGPMQRFEITAKLWQYIRDRGLQDVNNRRAINADDALRPIFDGADAVTMFELATCVSRHVTKVEG